MFSDNNGKKNIVPQQPVETALGRITNEQLCLALDFAQIGFWSWDLQTDQVEWNEIHCLLLGLTPGTTTAGYNIWQERVHSEDIERVEALIRHAIVTQTSYEAEYRICYPDGSIRWLISKGQAVYHPSGQPIRMTGALMDITDRKLAEQEREQLFAQEQAARTEVLYLNQRLRQLVQVIQQLASARNLETIMAAVRCAARQLVGADGTTFVLREGEFCYYADEEAIAPLWRGQRFPIENCISGWAMLNRTSVVIPDIFSDARISQRYYRPTFVKSLAMLPIHTIEPIGAIGVYWARQYSPTAEEVNLLQTLADAAAIAIQNVHLYEDLEHRVQERTTQLQQSLNFEALLKRITEHLRDSLDEANILQAAIEELAQGLSLLACDAGIYNTEQTTSTIAYEFTSTLASVQGCVIEMATAPHAEIYPYLLDGQFCLFCNIALHSARSGQGLLSILAVPILDDQGVLGDMWLFKPADEIFDAQEVRLVQQVANQCAIGLRQSRLYQAAQSQVTALEQLGQLKDDFLSTVSHELRSPMANIKMVAKMLEVALNVVKGKQAGSASEELILSSAQTEKVIHYLKILNHECQRETRLIDDLLDLARLDAGMKTLTLTKVCLQEWMPRITQSFTERSNQQQQRLQIYIPSDLPLLITDSPSLERIVTELVHNACKYTPAGETITVSVEMIRAEGHEEGKTELLPKAQFRLSVSNSGVEIPVEVCDRIFDKFYRVPNNDPWKHGGTGLGLALVKKLVELLGGTISVTSKDNSTRFTVLLPHHGLDLHG